jgi:hypothetical protein
LLPHCPKNLYPTFVGLSVVDDHGGWILLADGIGEPFSIIGNHELTAGHRGERLKHGCLACSIERALAMIALAPFAMIVSRRRDEWR